HRVILRAAAEFGRRDSSKLSALPFPGGERWSKLHGLTSCKLSIASAPRRAIAAGLAAALLDQPDAFDAHAALDRLRHVVDRQARGRHGGQRLPPYPRLAPTL